MAALSGYLGAKLLDHTLSHVAYTSPATVYLGFFTDDVDGDGDPVEVSGSPYARKAITFDPADNILKQATSNIDVTITVPDCTVAEGGIFDAVSGGNLLYYAEVNDIASYTGGSVITVPAGGVVVRLK